MKKVNKKLKEKYLQHLDTLMGSIEYTMVKIYLTQTKKLNMKNFVMGGIPVKNEDFLCFLDFQKNYIKKYKNWFFAFDCMPSVEDAEAEMIIQHIEKMEKDQLLHRIVLAMEISDNYDLIDFIEYLKDNPFLELELITQEYESLLASEIQYIEDMELEDVEDLKDFYEEEYPRIYE